MSRKRVKVTLENTTGRNQRFKDNYTGDTMTRNQFVNKINKGEYENYHIRVINDIPTPVSNPDRERDNNLG